MQDCKDHEDKDDEAYRFVISLTRVFGLFFVLTSSIELLESLDVENKNSEYKHQLNTLEQGDKADVN